MPLIGLFYDRPWAGTRVQFRQSGHCVSQTTVNATWLLAAHGEDPAIPQSVLRNEDS
jgi:hypothetical protein